MKKHFLIITLGVALAATVITSCKTSSVNPSSASLAPEVFFRLTTDNAMTTLAVSPGNGLAVNAVSTGSASVNWTAGTANIAHFKLEAKKHNTEIEINSKNLANVNLFNIAPLFIGATIDTGTYKEIEVRVVLEKTTSADLPLLLKGTFTTPAGATVPIELDFNDDAVIKAESDNVVVDGTKDITNTVSMHLNKLLVNVTAAQLDAATRTNNAILISGTVNTSIYHQIKSNITSSCESKGFEKHEKTDRGKDH